MPAPPRPTRRPSSTRSPRSSSRRATRRRRPSSRRAPRRRRAAARRSRGRAPGRVRSHRAARQRGGRRSALGDGTFIRPVSGPITSPFGYRTDPVTGATAFHAGIDFGAPCGTPIKAAGTGVIISAGFNSGGYGNMTLINHGDGLSTLYGHQSSIIVSPGQSVSPGSGDRLRRLHRQVDRVPPPLRGAGQRQPRRPDRTTSEVERGAVGGRRLLVRLGRDPQVGLEAFQPFGNFALASSSLTAGTMMTSSPSFQFTGVATW